jgi:hypothetical protein
MPIIYRTPGAWGAGKGSDLSPAEADGNFYTLEQQVQDLITNPPTAVGVSNIVVAGASVMFYMTDGGTFGPFPLPYVTFKIRAQFDSSVASSYAPLDLIPVSGVGLFLSRFDHDYAIGEEFNPDLVDGTDPVYVKVFGEDTFIYDIGFFYPGSPGAGIAVGSACAGHMPVHDIYLPAGLAASFAKLTVAPAADLDFDIQQSGVSIGTMSFAAGETTATFSFTADVQFLAADHDTLTIIRPTTIDTAARELFVTLSARRGLVGS